MAGMKDYLKKVALQSIPDTAILPPSEHNDGEKEIVGYTKCPRCKSKWAYYGAYINNATSEERTPHWVNCDDCEYEAWTQEHLDAAKNGII